MNDRDTNTVERIAESIHANGKTSGRTTQGEMVMLSFKETGSDDIRSYLLSNEQASLLLEDLSRVIFDNEKRAAIPSTDGEAHALLRKDKSDSFYRTLLGIYRCRREMGDSVIDAYEKTLLSAIGER